MKKFITSIIFAVVTYAGDAATWLVGPSQIYQKPSQVAGLVQNGDTVLIEAGTYPGDVARWTADNLLIKGVNGVAHLKSGGAVYGGKAIWVIVGDDVTVENIEFSEAKCPDRNGAGIRSEGINLTLRHCFFHHNENGILAGDIASGDFLIEYCEFAANGYPDGQAHNLYINHANSVTFRFNYSHDALVGHEYKSRAYTNLIYCNRFSDENGSASRSIDLPNGGLSILIGNIIVQDPNSENSNIVGFGMEGLSNPNSELYLAYNTLVNNKQTGSFVQFPNATPKVKAWDNIFAGPGTRFSGAAAVLDTAANLSGSVASFHFADALGYNFHLEPSSSAIGAALDPGLAGAVPLTPLHTYLHPANSENRLDADDVGAYHITNTTDAIDATLYSSPIAFPNPTSGRFELKNLGEGSEIFIFNASGKVAGNFKGNNSIDLSRFPSGTYLIIAREGKKTAQLRIVKL